MRMQAIYCDRCDRYICRDPDMMGTGKYVQITHYADAGDIAPGFPEGLDPYVTPSFTDLCSGCEKDVMAAVELFIGPKLLRAYRDAYEQQERERLSPGEVPDAEAGS